MSQNRSSKRLPLLIFAGVLLLLLAAYLPTLQTIPNGSEHYYMIDVGETQIVLNVYGTLHATGYPLYVMIGSVAVTILKAFGIHAAAAPAVVSLLWGLGALTLMLTLALHCTPTRRWLPAAGVVLLFGLTRTVWIHQVIAEIYSMTLLLLAALLLIALRQPRLPGRLYLLALIGGIGVAHHRALIVAAPALIYAVLPDLIIVARRHPLRLAALPLLGLIGLLPYGYLMLRANAGASWVYGEPGTLNGLWDQFIGREASRFIGMPATLDGLIANIQMVSSTLLTDLSLLGVLLGAAGLILGAARPGTRRAAVPLLLSGGAAYLFHCFFYTDILSALILAVTFSLAFGWLFLVDAFLSLFSGRRLTLARAAAATAALIPAVMLFTVNRPFISALTGDQTGIETIAMAQHAPPGSTLMLAWGPRYFAVGFARSVLGALPGVDLVDHKANYRAVLAEGTLVTPSYTFYRQPLAWWEEKIGGPVYLSAVAPQLVGIATTPARSGAALPAATAADVSVFAHRLTCTPLDLIIEVDWMAHRRPEKELSIFVHLLDHAGAVRAQDDHDAPVYGLRPLTTWSQGEVVRDYYVLPRLSVGERVRYGLYTQHADGSFENLLEVEMLVDCGG
ncbi:MAG: DUF2723 domain-containing protein [Anaerolineae bacterium]|nr:DUF2723 domain-containing protein [Anaerolineae bacterium]